MTITNLGVGDGGGTAGAGPATSRSSGPWPVDAAVAAVPGEEIVLSAVGAKYPERDKAGIDARFQLGQEFYRHEECIGHALP
ncbi:MAG: hypothetical protein R2856_10370 [Caldilineaceae bacterium]